MGASGGQRMAGVWLCAGVRMRLGLWAWGLMWGLGALAAGGDGCVGARRPSRASDGSSERGGARWEERRQRAGMADRGFRVGGLCAERVGLVLVVCGVWVWGCVCIVAA